MWSSSVHLATDLDAWRTVRYDVVQVSSSVCLLCHVCRKAWHASLVGAALQVTYPLDTLRLRIAVDPGVRSISSASSALLREGSYSAFFRGLGASLVGKQLLAFLVCLQRLALCQCCIDTRCCSQSILHH